MQKKYSTIKLKGKTDPEQKRKTIGKLFIKVFQKEAKRIKNISLLGPGNDLSRRN